MPFEHVGRYVSSKGTWVSSSADLQDFQFRWAWEPIADAWMSEFKGFAVSALKLKAPVGKHYDLTGTSNPTYAFRNSLYSVTRHAPESVSIDVSSRVPHAPYIIHGTSAHLITKSSNILQHRVGMRGPTGRIIGSSNTLAFWWSKGGFPVFTPYVQHPGTKPNTFNVEVRDALAPLARDTLIAQIRRRYTV